LAATYELRNGIPQGASPKTAGPDVLRAMSTGLYLDYLGIRMDAKKAEGMSFNINLITPDNGEKYAVEMSNGALTNIEGYTAEKPDLTITIDRADLDTVLMGQASFDEQIKNGKAKLKGDRKVYEQLKSTLVDFQLGFEMMPGTGAVKDAEPTAPFQAENPVLPE